MENRYDAIGIKQVIRLEWIQKAAHLVLAGTDAKAIRQELHSYLAERRGDGSQELRSEETRRFVVNILMRTWVSPDTDLIPFRDVALTCLRDQSSMALAVHWAMISSAYPFWFHVARQAGRILNLQNQVTRQQIVTRLKEQYGDRETVSRYARYVLRSFVAWGVLRDSAARGCYEKADPFQVGSPHAAILLLEATLQNSPNSKPALTRIQSEPAFFPFQLPLIPESFLLRSDRIDVLRYGVDEVYLDLKKRSPLTPC